MRGTAHSRCVLACARIYAAALHFRSNRRPDGRSEPRHVLLPLQKRRRLVDRAIESELLERHSIVHEVLLMTTGEIDRMPLDSMQRHIERTVLLVRQGGGEHVMNVVFDIFRNIWRAVLCPNGEALSLGRDAYSLQRAWHFGAVFLVGAK